MLVLVAAEESAVNGSSYTPSSVHVHGSSSPDIFSKVKPSYSNSIDVNFNTYLLPKFRSSQFLQLGMLDCPRQHCRQPAFRLFQRFGTPRIGPG